MIYAIYDFTADLWSLLGDYPTQLEAEHFYRDLLGTPFWRDRLTAMYCVGTFSSENGALIPQQPRRIETCAPLLAEGVKGESLPLGGGVPGGLDPTGSSGGLQGGVSPQPGGLGDSLPPVEGVQGDGVPPATPAYRSRTIWNFFKNRFFHLN